MMAVLCLVDTKLLEENMMAVLCLVDAHICKA